MKFRRSGSTCCPPLDDPVSLNRRRLLSGASRRSVRRNRRQERHEGNGEEVVLEGQHCYLVRLNHSLFPVELEHAKKKHSCSARRAPVPLLESQKSPNCATSLFKRRDRRIRTRCVCLYRGRRVQRVAREEEGQRARSSGVHVPEKRTGAVESWRRETEGRWARAAARPTSAGVWSGAAHLRACVRPSVPPVGGWIEWPATPTWGTKSEGRKTSASSGLQRGTMAEFPDQLYACRSSTRPQRGVESSGI
ncbi:hypothetical protein SRHO_G00323930 [Serrasalmus rhombeus]